MRVHPKAGGTTLLTALAKPPAKLAPGTIILVAAPLEGERREFGCPDKTTP